MDLVESVGQALVREVREETGLEVQPTGLVGIYSDPGHVIAYANGEVRQEFSICFTARIVGGEVSVADEESTEVRFVPNQRARPARDAPINATPDPAFCRAQTNAVLRVTTAS